jgi:type II secretory pathway pseudopilin PulG
MMKTSLPPHSIPPRRPAGMVIMEVVIALAIFGMAATGLIHALISSVKSASYSQTELRMLLRLQSTLNEYSKYPRIQEYENQSFDTDPDELGIWTRTEVIKLEGVENMEGQPLEEMYEVRVTAFFDDFGQEGKVQASTVRYARLYAVTGAANGGPAVPGAPTPAPAP